MICLGCLLFNDFFLIGGGVENKEGRKRIVGLDKRELEKIKLLKIELEFFELDCIYF